MDKYECYNKYLSARMRFDNELEAIQKEYISSNFSFKVGDIVRYKFIYDSTPQFACIKKIELTGAKEDDKYRFPHVRIEGHEVDEEGYLRPLLKGGYEPVSCHIEPDEIIEVTTIQYKGLR